MPDDKAGFWSLIIAALTLAAGCGPGSMDSSRASRPLRTRQAAEEAQGWVPQDSGTTDLLYAVSFVSPDTGTAVGDNGTILHTTDGGSTWTAQASGTTQVLFGVSFVDAQTGTAVGDNGTILHTADGGGTWTAQASGTTSILYAVSFVDPYSGTVVGDNGTILHTADGGSTWTAQPSGTAMQLRGVTFVDASAGTAVGGDGWSTTVILRTTDGGATWTPQDPGTPYPARLTSISFADASTGMAVGWAWDFEGGGPYTVIQRTTDGGSGWMPADAGYAQSNAQLFGVSVQDANTATAVGSGYDVYCGCEYALIMRTTDGGTSWALQDGGSQGLQGVSFVSVSTGTAVGGDILHTITGGR